MADTFKLQANTTKKEIIDQYKRVLEAYRKKVAEHSEAEKRLSELERHKEQRALAAAGDATVASVVESIGQLRGQVSQALGELTDKLTARAEQLEELKRSAALQERRLQELYDIEQAADALAKLTDAYEERRVAAKEEYVAALAEMTREHQQTQSEQERELTERRDELEQEIARIRAQWKEEREQEKKRRAEEQAEIEKAREREEADYLYQRDRERKLEEDRHHEQQAAQERELATRRETLERSWTEREACLAEREQELARLHQEVDAFPVTLQQELERARTTADAAARQELAQRISSLEADMAWEKKMSQQRLEHLQGIIEAQESKLKEVHGDLTAAHLQVHEIAEKAIEGAAANMAFKSVNQIALEQSRRQDREAKA